MKFDERKKWVDALLACPTVRKRKRRDVIVDELPQEICTRISRDEVDHVDVMNILKRILDFDGLAKLMDIVNFYEGPSQPMEVVNRLYEQICPIFNSEDVDVLEKRQTDQPALYSSNNIPTQREMTQSHPKNSSDYNNRGAAYYSQGKYTEAIADFDQAIQLNPKDAVAYNNRGNAYSSQGKYTEAIADLNQAIQLNPEDDDAYYNRGIAYFDQGKYFEAIDDYGRAIQLNPEDAVFYNNRGNAYGSQGRYNEAIADFDRAIQLNPEDAAAYTNRGSVYSSQGQYTQAIADFDRAIQLNPESAIAYYNQELIRLDTDFGRVDYG